MLRLRLLAIWLGIALNGCVTAQFNHPLALMEDPTTQDTTWRHAARQAQRQMPKHPDRLQVLYRLVSNESAPAWQHQYAVGQLIQYDSQRLRTLLLNDVVSIDDWSTWDHLLDRVISLEWSSLTPLIVRQYARPRAFTADRDRLEFQALRSLNPKSSPQQVIQDVISGSYPFKAASPTVRLRDQMLAWELASRLYDSKTLHTWVKSMPAQSRVSSDLKAAAGLLGVLPRGREGLLWLRYIMGERNLDWRTRAQEVLAQINSVHRRQIQLRHLPFLIRADQTLLQLDRSQLITRLRRNLARRAHHLAAASFDARAKPYPQDLDHWVDKLSWPDLVAIDLLFDAMSDPRLISQLFGQADADHLETSTEHGGVLVFNDPASNKNNSGNKTPVEMKVRAHAYQSIQKTRDDAFYPPPSMITHLYTALAHYHFHAQTKTNAHAAGPGRVDRQLAARLPACYLVFSFINQDQLNIDYYQQGGVVIDLGTIARPQPGS